MLQGLQDIGRTATAYARTRPDLRRLGTAADRPNIAQIKRDPPLSIYLVEDNENLAVGLLEKQGHTATITTNGQKVLDLLE